MGMTRLRFLSMVSSSFALAATGSARLLASGSSQTVTFSPEFFLPLKGTTFTVRDVRMVLEDVKAGPQDRLTNQFSLSFSGPKNSRLSEGTYSVTHSGLDSFSLHVSPSGLRGDGKKLYRADFNLLR